MKPTPKGIPSSNMGLRNQEVRPVGAWAEPKYQYNPETQCDAQLSAVHEEERLKRVIKEKEEKLIKFQDDVKRRVRQMAKVKKMQQLQKSFRSLQTERNVMKKGGFASPKKNKCDLLSGEELRMEVTSPVPPGVVVCDSGKQLDDKTHEVSKQTKEARRKLVSRKVVTDSFIPDDLPGAPWKDAWGDHPAGRNTEQVNTTDTEEDFTPPVNVERKIDVEEVREDVPKVVQFNLENQEETREDGIKRKSAAEISGTDVERPLTQPEVMQPHLEGLKDRLGEPANLIGLHPVISEEEMKTQIKNQRALYRRLFMDIEREQVKENQKKKHHRMKIAKMKKAVEDERRRQEQVAREMTLPRDPVTGETNLERLQREAVEDSMSKEMEEKNNRMFQKAKEMDRYVEALKSNLGRKADVKNITLPLLCCCATTFWDTHPDTCANNCQFYKNPRGYAKALQSLLQSCELA